MTLRFVALVVAIGAGACSSSTTLPLFADSDVCYQAQYRGVDVERAYMPPVLALRRGQSTGALDSKPAAADTGKFWAMFQNREARWFREDDDSLELRFTNDFTSVIYYLRPQRDRLIGIAVINYDFGEHYPQFVVEATKIDCSLFK